jgi:hypothetical protein
MTIVCRIGCYFHTDFSIRISCRVSCFYDIFFAYEAALIRGLSVA